MLLGWLSIVGCAGAGGEQRCAVGHEHGAGEVEGLQLLCGRAGDGVIAGAQADRPEAIGHAAAIVSGGCRDGLVGEVEAVSGCAGGGKELDGGCEVGAGGDDLFVEHAVGGEDVDAFEAEVASAGGDAELALAGFSGRRCGWPRGAGGRLRRALKLMTMGGSMSMGRRFDAAGRRGLGEVVVLLPDQLAEFGVDGVEGVGGGDEDDVFEALAVDDAADEEGFGVGGCCFGGGGGFMGAPSCIFQRYLKWAGTESTVRPSSSFCQPLCPGSAPFMGQSFF